MNNIVVKEIIFFFLGTMVGASLCGLALIFSLGL